MNKLTFSPVNQQQHLTTLFKWLDSSHVREFWDNSQAHRDDIKNFIEGRKTPSNYFNGIFDYWIGFVGNTPFCFMLTSEYKKDNGLPNTHQKQLAIEGKTLGIDFCIGNIDFLGTGIASTTLVQFMEFISQDIDPETKRFFIDPSINNPRAIHVYEKAGFKRVGEFTVEEGFFENNISVLLIKDV